MHLDKQIYAILQILLLYCVSKHLRISACNVIIFSILLMDQFISYTHSYMV